MCAILVDFLKCLVRVGGCWCAFHEPIKSTKRKEYESETKRKTNVSAPCQFLIVRTDFFASDGVSCVLLSIPQSCVYHIDWKALSFCGWRRGKNRWNNSWSQNQKTKGRSIDWNDYIFMSAHEYVLMSHDTHVRWNWTEKERRNHANLIECASQHRFVSRCIYMYLRMCLFSIRICPYPAQASWLRVRLPSARWWRPSCPTSWNKNSPSPAPNRYARCPACTLPLSVVKILCFEIARGQQVLWLVTCITVSGRPINLFSTICKLTQNTQLKIWEHRNFVMSLSSFRWVFPRGC